MLELLRKTDTTEARRTRKKLFFGSLLVTIVLAILLSASTAFAQTSSFTYQGRLTDGGTAANGNYDLQFALFDSLSGGAQVGSTQTLNTVAVSNGVFTVSLDFGANSFPGANRFLEISARPTGGSFTLLTPRQQVTSTPYAIRSANASSADTATNATNATNATTATNATQLGGIAASQYVQTNDSRLSDARPPTPGSSNYIQNSSAQQSASNFNISGNGTAGGTLSGNLVNATTQYNLNGSRILSNAGSENLFAGAGTGAVNTGQGNSFFGAFAGAVNTTGSDNAFFGDGAGANSLGSKNAFFGTSAGNVNSMGNLNTAVGYGSNFGRGDLLNATAIGSHARVDASNALVLGSINGVNAATADTNVGIGTTAPIARLHVVGDTFLVGSLGIGTALSTRTLMVAGRARVSNIPQEPSGASLCFNVNGDLLQCGASSLKWKTNVRSFRSGLDIIQQLRPISFNWKEDGRPDIGLGAEEVAKVAPSLTFTDDKGEVTGVKYERLSMLLINAIKEQQAIIEHQQSQLERQDKQISGLKKLVCRSRRRAAVCK